MKVTLTVVKGPKRGRVMEFEEPRGFVIGRAADADFQLPQDDPYVSRRGILLEICPPHCRLQDIGCTNPPEVNGKPVVACEIADGDILELGYTQFKVSLTTQVAPRVWRCGACGQSIELLPSEPAPERCPACVEKQRQAVQKAQAARPVHCSSCRTDLTKQANSDGRAEEFQNVAVYACDQHIPPGDKFAGAMVGDYEIRKLLGEGGMGAVYLVYHRRTARILALKQMKDLKDALLVKRFDREIRLLKGLAHQNVVRCIDMGIDGKGAPYLVTEYVSNGCLEDEVAAQGGRLRHDLAVNLIGEVLNGLDYIHGQSIIHRDIKPQNILLRHTATTGAPGFFTPKLADFGLAVSYARAGGTRVTKRGTGLGTLMFMPPEQIRDAGTVQKPADTYAVGVTLYYLLTGQYPFNFPTPAEVLEFQKKMKGEWKKPQEVLQALMQLKRIMHPFQVILSEEPTPIQQRDPSIPRKLAAVVDKAIRKDAQKRFQSAAEFRGALQQAVR
jgi:eukaryotic-like serine/threonine-protein kinase